MDIIGDKNGNNLTIKLSGNLDTNTSPELSEYLDDNLNLVEDLVFDFEDLVYISSSGLRIILATQKIMNNQGEMKIINVNEFILDVFEDTGFIDIINIET